ncbi:uncharacterized protein LOC144201398 [Stigmatopora nigra]
MTGIMCPEDEPQSQQSLGCGSSAKLGVTLTCGNLDGSHEVTKTIWTSSGLNRTPQVEIHCPCNVEEKDKGFGSFVKRLMEAEGAIVIAAAQLVSFQDTVRDAKLTAANRQYLVKQKGVLLQKMEDFREINQIVRQKLNLLMDDETDRFDASTKIDALLNKILQMERENELLKGDLGVTERRAEELMHLQQKEQENIKSALNIAKSAEGTRARIQGQLRNKEAENNRLTVQVRTLERCATQHKSQVDDLKSHLSALTEQSSQEKEALKKASRVHKQKAERMEAAVYKCSCELKEKDTQLSTLQETKDQLTKENQNLKAQVEFLQKQVTVFLVKRQKETERHPSMPKDNEWEKEWDEKMKDRKEEEEKWEEMMNEKKEQEEKEWDEKMNERKEQEEREWEERMKGREEHEMKKWDEMLNEQKRQEDKDVGTGEDYRKNRERERRRSPRTTEDGSEREEWQRVEKYETNARLNDMTQQLERLKVEKEQYSASNATLQISVSNLEKQLAECEAELDKQKTLSIEKDRKLELLLGDPEITSIQEKRSSSEKEPEDELQLDKTETALVQDDISPREIDQKLDKNEGISIRQKSPEVEMQPDKNETALIQDDNFSGEIDEKLELEQPDERETHEKMRSPVKVKTPELQLPESETSPVLEKKTSTETDPEVVEPQPAENETAQDQVKSLSNEADPEVERQSPKLVQETRTPSEEDQNVELQLAEFEKKLVQEKRTSSEKDPEVELQVTEHEEGTLVQDRTVSSDKDPEVERKLAESEIALIQEKKASSEKDRNIEQLQNQVATLEAELNKFRLEYKNVSKELHRVQVEEASKVKTVREDLQAREEELQKLSKTLREAEIKLQRCQENLQSSESKCSEKSDVIEKLQFELQTRENLVKSVGELQASAEETSSKLSQQVDTLQKQLEQLNQEKLQLQQKLEAKEEALRDSNRQFEEQRTRWLGMERQLEQQAAEAQTLNRELAQCSAENGNLKEQVKHAKDKATSKEVAFEKSVKELRLLRQTRLASENRLQARVKELQLSLDKCERHRKSIQNYVDFLKTSYIMIFEDQISTFWSSNFIN